MFIDCFRDYLKEKKLGATEVAKRLGKCGYYLSQHIGSVRRKLYKDVLKCKSTYNIHNSLSITK